MHMVKVISIAQQKGGAGKSTIAAHLAVALAQQNRRVALVDIDPQGSLTMWHTLREKQFGKGYTGINFVSSSGWRVGNAISQCKVNVDFVIIDSPPHTETEAKGAIREADFVIIPMQPSPTDLWATKATLDFAKSEKKLVKVLLNRYNPASRIAREITSHISDRLTSHIGNRVVFASCLAQGRCVTESDPQSQAAEEIKALVQEVLELVEDNTVTHA